MNNATNNTQLLEILRDFFYFGTQDSIKLTYEKLKQLKNEQPKSTNWTEEEYCYNRLFVGPAMPYAPIVASYYLETAQHYNGAVTSTIKHLYTAVGLKIPEGLNIPEDSLPLELDAYLYMLGQSSQNKDAAELAGHFTSLHLLEWLPLFIEKADRQDNTEAVSYVINTLRNWVESHPLNTN